MKRLLTFAFAINAIFCISQTVTNGSVTGTASNSGINAGNATGWSGCSYSPDVCDITRPSYVTTSQVTPCPSPDGGTWLGLASMSPAGATECAQTTITGLTIGQSYNLTFWAACFGTATSICNNSPATPTVTVGGVTSQMYTIPMAANTWVACSLPFTATATTMALEAKHSSIYGGYYAYVGLDGFTFGSVPLPIELSKFGLDCGHAKVNVKWTAATESNNDFFTIERSRDGQQFNTMAIVNGSGTNTSEKTYSWIDEYPLPGTSYYRISQTDFDGTTKVFEAESIDCDDMAGTFVYPNPFENQLTITAQHSGTIELVSLTGQTVWSSTFNAGETQMSIEDVTAGAYMAHVRLSNGDLQIVKLEKIK